MLVAITGGIGAGKSTVAELLRQRGARLVDADRIAREVVDPVTEAGRQALIEIASVFGEGILRDDGTLDRQRVAEAIFSDGSRRAEYNRIVHPRILRATQAALTQLADDEIVVHEIPLLTANTAPLPWRYDLIITVEADDRERLERLVRERGYSREHARARIEAQGTAKERISIADIVLRTDGELAETHAAVDAVWRRLSQTSDPDLPPFDPVA